MVTESLCSTGRLLQHAGAVTVHRSEAGGGAHKGLNVRSYAALSGDDGTEEPLLGGRKTKKKKMVKHRIVAVSAWRSPETGSDGGAAGSRNIQASSRRPEHDPADLAWCV